MSVFPTSTQHCAGGPGQETKERGKITDCKRRNKTVFAHSQHYCLNNTTKCFPGGSVGKESTCNAGDPGSITGSEISPGEGNGYPLEYSCLENSKDRGAWQATVNGIRNSGTRLSD